MSGRSGKNNSTSVTELWSNSFREMNGTTLKIKILICICLKPNKPGCHQWPEGRESAASFTAAAADPSGLWQQNGSPFKGRERKWGAREGRRRRDNGQRFHCGSDWLWLKEISQARHRIRIPILALFFWGEEGKRLTDSYLQWIFGSGPIGAV